eukprot:3924561-Amphidinium_carterae.1
MYINRVIGTPTTLVEALPVDILSHDTVEAKLMQPGIAYEVRGPEPVVHQTHDFQQGAAARKQTYNLRTKCCVLNDIITVSLLVAPLMVPRKVTLFEDVARNPISSFAQSTRWLLGEVRNGCYHDGPYKAPKGTPVAEQGVSVQEIGTFLCGYFPWLSSDIDQIAGP